MNDENKLEIILTQIEKNWPDWIEWYQTLDAQKQNHLIKRIIADGEQFIKTGMWEYGQYAAFRDSPAQKSRRAAQEKQESKEELMSLNRELAVKYNFNLMEKNVIPISKYSSHTANVLQTASGF